MVCYYIILVQGNHLYLQCSSYASPTGAKIRGDTSRRFHCIICDEQYSGSSMPANHHGETPELVDKLSNISDTTSTTDSMGESSGLDAPHLLHLDSTSLASQLQDTSSVELNLFLSMKNIWTMPIFHKQMSS